MRTHIYKKTTGVLQEILHYKIKQGWAKQAAHGGVESGGECTIRHQPDVCGSQSCGYAAGGAHNTPEHHGGLGVVYTQSLGHKGGGYGDHNGLDHANGDADGNHFGAGTHGAACDGTNDEGAGATANGGKTFGIRIAHEIADGASHEERNHGAYHQAKQADETRLFYFGKTSSHGCAHNGKVAHHGAAKQGHSRESRNGSQTLVSTKIRHHQTHADGDGGPGNLLVGELLRRIIGHHHDDPHKQECEHQTVFLQYSNQFVHIKGD